MDQCVRALSKTDDMGRCLAYQRHDCCFCSEIRAEADAGLARTASRSAYEAYKAQRNPGRAVATALGIYERGGVERIADFDGAFWDLVRGILRQLETT